MKIKNKLVILILIASIVLSMYTGGWLLFLKPIFTVYNLFYIGELTGGIIFKTIVECIFAPIVSWIIFGIGYIISMVIINI
jgi:hypothetical protein